MREHSELIEQVRAEHWQYNGTDWCRCGFPTPCTTARLAAALGEAEKANQFLARDAYDSGRLAERLADDALIALSGAHVGTPVEGYLKAPYCLKGDINDLARERDDLRTCLAAAERERAAALTQRADFEVGLTLCQDDLATATRELASALEKLARRAALTHPEWMSSAGKAFRERFAYSPDAKTSPLGFFEAGAEWAAALAPTKEEHVPDVPDCLSVAFCRSCDVPWPCEPATKEEPA